VLAMNLIDIPIQTANSKEIKNFE